MKIDNKILQVTFETARELKEISLETLIQRTVQFLEYFGDVPIVSRKFAGIIKSGSGEVKFKRLLQAAGYSNDPEGFFAELTGKLSRLPKEKNIRINELRIPYHLLLHLLEAILPGDQVFTVKSVHQLQKLTNRIVPKDKQADLKQIINDFPVKFSLHTLRQMLLSEAVAYQYMPFSEELNKAGHVHTWVGQFHRGIIEQMYENRLIFVLNMSCPVYCRFCFRKHKECRYQKSPSKEHVQQALMYVRNNPRIKEIVLTGGDPFMNRATLTHAIDHLINIPHIKSIRVATRSISYHPYLFNQDNGFWTNFLKSKNQEARQKNKIIEVATHFIHPEEVSIQSLDIISELTASGIPVYVQTPLLNKCNDTGKELVELYKLLRGAGAEIHYIFLPCSPIQGNQVYKTSIAQGIKVGNYLRAYLTDRAVPHLCTATAIGKIDWGTSGWIVEIDEDDPEYMWIRTPYTKEYFESFTPILQFSRTCRQNAEGTLDIKYMAEIGDESLIRPWPQPTETAMTSLPLSGEPDLPVDYDLDLYKTAALRDQRKRNSIVETGSDSLFRCHRTWAELDCYCSSSNQKQNISKLKKWWLLTDIVISGETDPLDDLYNLTQLITQIKKINHINAIRIRSLKLNYYPKQFHKTLIKTLGSLRQNSVVNPKRIEIEVQFLHSREFLPEHMKLCTEFRHNGVTIYNNTPILRGINSDPDEILALSNQLRLHGIEFNSLVVAGHSLQKLQNTNQPLTAKEVTDIASQLRQNGSGREIPRFVVSTVMGEIDFGYGMEIIDVTERNNLLVTLKPYNLEYYKKLDPEFTLPNGVELDAGKRPILEIEGLTI